MSPEFQGEVRKLSTPSGGVVYQYMFTKNGKVVLKSKGAKYVAFVVFQNPQDPKSKVYMSHRFGREDLIWGGQSKSLRNLPGYHLIRVKHED